MSLDNFGSWVTTNNSERRPVLPSSKKAAGFNPAFSMRRARVSFTAPIRLAASAIRTSSIGSLSVISHIVLSHKSGTIRSHPHSPRRPDVSTWNIPGAVIMSHLSPQMGRESAQGFKNNQAAQCRHPLTIVNLVPPQRGRVFVWIPLSIVQLPVCVPSRVVGKHPATIPAEASDVSRPIFVVCCGLSHSKKTVTWVWGWRNKDSGMTINLHLRG